MGIKGIWDVIGEGEVHSLAEYAATFFKRHYRPLRIAVDEACWRFTNLTPEQVQKIVEQEPAANPVEKVILWRILRLLKLNVQLLFVNDGARRPWKRDKRGGGKLDYELIRLTRQMLDRLKIPHHQAPGEAEAECARLQALGIVDAVWSDDSDALMFGCGTLIRQHKNGGERVKDHIRVYEASTLLNKYDLDPDGLVLFAVLAGGDYETEGLRGCGPQTAALLAKRNVGLSQALRNSAEPNLPSWRALLQNTLQLYRKPILVPYGFPQYRALNYYRNPTISTDEQLFNLRGLRQGWERPIDQTKLRVMLRERFNFTTREFLKHISPIFMLRRLARATTPEQKTENLEFGIQLKRTRQKKDENEEPKTETKILFSPLPVVEIDLSQQPPEEDWSKFAAEDGTPYTPTQPVECEVLDCFLRNGLPEGAIEYVQPAKRKRAGGDSTQETSPTKKRKRRKAAEDVESSQEPITATQDHNSNENRPVEAPKKRGRSKKQQSQSATQKTTPKKRTPKATKSKQQAAQEEPPLATFRAPQALLGIDMSVFGPGDGDRIPDASVQGAVAASLQPKRPPAEPLAPQSTIEALPPAQLVPGETISREKLRELRATAFLGSGNSLFVSPDRPRNTNSVPPTKAIMHEVIDLT